MLSCFRLEQRPCELIERPTNERQIPDPDDEDTKTGDEATGDETCHGSSIWCSFPVDLLSFFNDPVSLHSASGFGTEGSSVALPCSVYIITCLLVVQKDVLETYFNSVHFNTNSDI